MTCSCEHDPPVGDGEAPAGDARSRDGSHAEPGDEIVVAVMIVRSGGIAGLSRRWAVEAPRADADRWITLVQECPWDECAPASPGADRFAWSVQATLADAYHRADLADAQVRGPWRTLIDAVRAASTPA